MNNNYDRDEVKSHSEMVAAGYEMTGDGFWVPNEENGDIEFEDMRPDHSIKLVLLKSGELLLTKYEEYTYSNSVKLSSPKVVISRSSATADGNVTTTIQYSQWMGLSSDEDFIVQRDFIVTVSNPIQSLYDSYLEGELNG